MKEVGRLGRSNHVMIQMSIDINMKELKMTKSVPNRAREEWESIRRGMRRINLDEALSVATVSEAWCKFRDTVTGLVENHVPLRPRRAPPQTGVANKRGDQGT